MTTGTVEGEFIATMDDPDDPEMFQRNRIHTNAGAQEYGFQGAFVGGVTLYAWCVPTVIEALGEEWLGTAPWLGDLRETPFSAPDLDGSDRPFLTLENAPIGQRLRTYGYGKHTPAPPAVGEKLAE